MFREIRRKKNEISADQCIDIIKSQRRAILAVVGDEGYPYAVPMNYVYNEENHCLYMHGAKVGHKFDAMKACNKVCVTICDEGHKKFGQKGIFVNSVIIMGKVRFVDDVKEITDAMMRFGVRFDRLPEMIQKQLVASMSVLQVFEIEMDHMSGKTTHEQ